MFEAPSKVAAKKKPAKAGFFCFQPICTFSIGFLVTTQLAPVLEGRESDY
jgi:hypothetical protein